MMKKLLIIAEGQTEEKFIKELIIPYFQKKNIYNIDVTILPNKTLASGQRFKGGAVTFKNVTNYAKKLLNSAYVTTLLDYYGIDRNFDGYDESKIFSDIKDKKETLEKKLAIEINNKKFIPYIQMYEFEGLLFSNPDSFVYIDEDPYKITDIKKEIAAYATPEHINDSPQTAPSKRLEKHYKGYTKTTDGIMVAEDMGIEKIIEKCPLFKEWLEKLENIFI
ncbi:MAG: DUF4276 family protein [Fusobacteriaceae bacterium]